MNLKAMLFGGAGIIALGVFGIGAYIVNQLMEKSEIAGTYALVAENNARNLQELRETTNSVLSAYGENMSALNGKVQTNRKQYFDTVARYDEVNLDEMAKTNPDAVTRLINDEYERLRLQLKAATANSKSAGDPETTTTTEAASDSIADDSLGDTYYR